MRIGLCERFPLRVDGLRVGEAGGVVASDGHPAGGAVRVEAPRGLARARGAVLGEEVQNASPGAYEAGRNRVPPVPAVPPMVPSGAPNRPLSQAASATSTTTVQHRRITRPPPARLVALSRDEHGNDPAHHRTYHVHEVVPSSRHSTDDAGSLPAAVNAPFGGLGATVAPPSLLHRGPHDRIGERPGDTAGHDSRRIVQ